MARYNNVLLTEQGRVLLSRVQMGECDLVITRAGTGDKIHGDEIDLTTLTQLGNEIQSFPISAYKRDGANIKLSFVATNFIPESGTGLEEEYYIQEIGIFARASNEEEEVLYGITKAVAAVHMPAYDEASPTTATFTINSYVGSGANVVIQESSEAYVPNVQYEEEMELVAEQINELKKSVSDGKSAVASAITAMGVSTESDATFETMATNISDISTDADAVASNILSGKTAYSGGAKVTGTMANNGAKKASLNCGGSYTIPAGYHNGSGKITANDLESQITGAAVASKYKHTFKALTDCPFDCQYGTAVYYDGKIYVHGSGSSDFVSMYSYDIYTGVWTKLADSPVNHQYPHTAVVVAGSIYYFGNWNGTGINLYRYMIRSNTWSDMEIAIPVGATASSCVQDCGVIRLVSSNYSGYRKKVYSFSLKTNAFTEWAETFSDTDAEELIGAPSPCITYGIYIYAFARNGTNCKRFSIAQPLSNLVNITMPGKTLGSAIRIGDYVYILSLANVNVIYRMALSDYTFTKIYATHYPYQSPAVAVGDEIFYFSSKTEGQENLSSVLHTCMDLETLY